MPEPNAPSNQIGDDVWRCGSGHDVLVLPRVAPYDMPKCPWCEVERLREALTFIASREEHLDRSGPGRLLMLAIAEAKNALA